MSKLLRSERGIALPMVLAVMFVLTISVLAIVQYTGANARNASLSKERQNAKGLAEDGFNRAASILHELVEANQAAPGDVDLPSGSVPAPDLPAGHSVSWQQIDKTGNGTSTVWTVRATGTVPNPTGPGGAPVTQSVQAKLGLTVETETDTTPWMGVFAAEQGDRPLMSDDNALIDTPVYVKQGYPSYDSNGVGTGTPLPVKITAGKFMADDFRVFGKLALEGSKDVTSVGASVRPSPSCGPVWPPATTGCQNVSWKSSFPAPLLRSELRMASFRVKFGCWMPEASSSAYTADNCRRTSSRGGDTGKIWLPCDVSPCPSTPVTSPAFSDEVANVQKPQEDYPARYAAAAPGATGRNHRCYANTKAQLEAMNASIGGNWTAALADTVDGIPWAGASNRIDNNTSRDNSLGTIDLLPSFAYDCRLLKADGTLLGRLTWQPGNPGTLTVQGQFYLDGNVTIGTSTNSGSTLAGWGKVVGATGTPGVPAAQVYVTDKILMEGTHSGLCGVPDTYTERQANGVTPLIANQRGRCLNGKKNDSVPGAQPPISGPEVWDPGTASNVLYFFSAHPNSTESVKVQGGFQFQGGIYTGCARYPTSLGSTVDPRCSALPLRSGLVVQDTGSVKGPVVVDSLEVKNSGVIAGWTPLTDLGDLPGATVTRIRLHLVAGSWRW